MCTSPIHFEVTRRSILIIFSNNSVRSSMTNLSLSTSAINAIIDDPTVLGSRLSASSSSKLAGLGITDAMAITILNGYTRGFRTLFIMNACLAAVATLASVCMIRHKELTRGDEDRLKEAARAGECKEKEKDLGMEATIPTGCGQGVEIAVVSSDVSPTRD